MIKIDENMQNKTNFFSFRLECPLCIFSSVLSQFCRLQIKGTCTSDSRLLLNAQYICRMQTFRATFIVVLNTGFLLLWYKESALLFRPHFYFNLHVFSFVLLHERARTEQILILVKLQKTYIGAR